MRPFWDATNQPRTYDVRRKDYNSDTKAVYVPHSFRVLSLIAASGLAKSRLKLDKGFLHA